MTGWLLDTNVVSELRRKKPDKNVVAFVASVPLHLLFISEITLAEIRFGIELQTDPVRRAELIDWLSHHLRPMFAERTLPVSEDVFLKWRLLVEQGRKTGHTFTQPDLFIAAIAAHHGLTVLTRDVEDYRRAHGVNVLNPWLHRG